MKQYRHLPLQTLLHWDSFRLHRRTSRMGSPDSSRFRTRLCRRRFLGPLPANQEPASGCVSCCF